MNDLKENIKKELEILENMISLNKGKKEIEKQREKLDKLLEEFLKNLNWGVFFCSKFEQFSTFLMFTRNEVNIYTKIFRLYRYENLIR